MGCLNIGFDGRAKFVPSHFRHHNVRKYQVRIVFSRHKQRVPSVGTGLDQVFLFQQPLKVGPQIVIVLHNKNTLPVPAGHCWKDLTHGAAIRSHAGFPGILFPGRSNGACLVKASAPQGKNNTYHGPLPLGTGNADPASVQPYQPMYHHQSDTVSRHLQIDGITAPEMVPEQFLPFLRWNANPRVFHFHTPYMPVHEGTDLDTPAPWSVLQCVGQYILQYRVHFVLVKPDIQVREAALTGDIDVPDGGICAECLTGRLQITVELIFRDMKSQGVVVRTLEIYQAGDQSQKSVHAFQGHPYIVHPLRLHHVFLHHLFQRSLDQRKRSTDIMGSMYEEARLFV